MDTSLGVPGTVEKQEGRDGGCGARTQTGCLSYARVGFHRSEAVRLKSEFFTLTSD